MRYDEGDCHSTRVPWPLGEEGESQGYLNVMMSTKHEYERMRERKMRDEVQLTYKESHDARCGIQR
jgi:hypothetical protein